MSICANSFEKQHWGEYITINPENGDDVISPIHRQAAKEMHAKHPEVLLFTIRIGYRAVGHFDGRGASNERRL